MTRLTQANNFRQHNYYSMILKLQNCWPWTAVPTLILILLQGLYVEATTPTSSMLDVGNVRGGSAKSDLADVFLYQDIRIDPVITRASEIIKTKLAGSTPLQDAAVKLIQTCKTANEPFDSFISCDQVKEAAIDLYSIKATDISLATAGIKSPKACSRFSGRSRTSWLHASISLSDELHNQNLAQERSFCVKALYKADNTWTSFENHKQDAKSLCETASVKYAPRIILELLNDIIEAIPSIAEIFREQEAQHRASMERAQDHARQMADAHQTQLRDAEDYYAAVMKMTEGLVNQTRAKTQFMFGELHSDLLGAGGNARKMRRLIEATTNEIEAYHDTQVILLQEIQSLFPEAAALVTQGMTTLKRTFMDDVHDLNKIYDGLAGQFEALSTTIQVGMAGIAASQAIVTQGQADFMILQRETTERQQKAMDMSDRHLSTVSLIDSYITQWGSFLHALCKVLELFSSHELLATLGIACIAIFLWLCRLNKLASMCAVLSTAILTLPSMWSIVLRCFRYVRIPVAHGHGTTIAFIAEHWYGLYVATGMSTLLAIILVGLYVIRRDHDAQTSRYDTDDRTRRSMTAAPDLLRPGCGRNRPAISKKRFLSEQQRLSLRMTKGRRSMV